MRISTILRITAAALAAVSTFNARADDADDVNREIFRRVYDAVREDAGKPTGELAVEIALELLGTPYVAGSIEQAPEELRVYLDRTDCILFVELCSSFALTLKSGNPCYETLVENIRRMRYRDGNVNGYSSRIHYSSEWLQQNASRGILYEYTGEFGEQIAQKFCYMSSHPENYSQLKGDSAEVLKIREMELRLEASGPYYAIPPEKIEEVQTGIREGDIICFLSKTEGIDIAHLGLAHKVDGKMHFIHASSVKGRVVISEQTLAQYVRNSKGVRLARLKQ